jgi:hypothetical protein
VKKPTKQRLEAKTLVVDASVARAAGERELVPSSSLCRRFLDAVFEHGHRCAMDVDLRKEWAHHESAYAKHWRFSMVSRRRIVPVRVDKAQVVPFIAELETTQAKKKAMMKDAHLVEVALLVDNRIASLDDQVRTLFSDASVQIESLRKIYWANPVTEGERCIGWVRKGAQDERRRLLTVALGK